MTTSVIFWIVGVLAFALSYAIGANDASNALATSYGADAAPLIFLLIGGAIMEMVGAVWCSGAVVTLAEKMIDGLYANPQATIEKMMLGTTLASFIFIMFASFFGMPISGTHTVIGALIGAGIAGVTVKYINWTKTGWTVASWFISPILSSIIALLLLALISTVCLGGFVENSQVKMTSACAISAISLAFIGFMVIWLAFDNPDPLMLEITLPVTFVIGWLQTRAAMTLEANKLSGYKMSKLQILKSTLLFWSYSDILEAEISDKSYGSYETALAFSTKASSQELDTNAQEKGLVIAVLKQAYRVMLIEAALTVSLAHGSNDVANSIAPLLVEMKVNTVNDEWAFWVGGAGIALGLLTLGYKVIQVVGKEVIVLDFYKGFACQFATANCIILGSKFGIPLSTTHCMVGSLFGIILCNKIPMVKVAYANLKENSLFEGDQAQSTFEQSVDSETASLDGPIGISDEKAKEVKDENSVNLETVKKILFFWGLTVPASLGMSYGITALLLLKS